MIQRTRRVEKSYPAIIPTASANLVSVSYIRYLELTHCSQ